MTLYLYIRIKTNIKIYIMKELKFRFWNKIVGRMSDNYTLEELCKQDVNFKLLEIQQFTGLLDKNGKEIYEGDIVKEGNYNSKVEWTFEASCSCCNTASGYYWSDDEAKNVEVIGNIYENPDLLST